MKNKIIAFSDVIQFSVGVNLSRLNSSKEDISKKTIYSIEDFEQDLNTSNESLEQEQKEQEKSNDKVIGVREGDCILNMIKSKAGIVSTSSAGKYLSINFVKCTIDKEKLYPWYFCYLFNEASSIKEQIYKNQQGSVKSVTRLNISMIKDIQFKLITLEEQKKIGDMYKLVLHQEYLLKHQANLLKQFTFELLKKLDDN